MRGLKRVTPRRVADAAQAAFLLARARLRIAKGGVASIASDDSQQSGPPLSPRDRAIVDRIAWAVAVAARYVPWRSDCLVQALAARAWLAAQGIDTRLVIGVPKQRGARFEAHAWLLCHGITVTGGDVARYSAFRSA